MERSHCGQSRCDLSAFLQDYNIWVLSKDPGGRRFRRGITAPSIELDHLQPLPAFRWRTGAAFSKVLRKEERPTGHKAGNGAKGKP